MNNLTDADVEAMASEPVSTKRERAFLDDRIEKLVAGQEIFKGVMGSSSK